MRLTIRVDSGTTIGSGHLIRCSALAEEARIQGHRVTFIGRGIVGRCREDLLALGCTVIDMPSTITSEPSWLKEQVVSLGATWVVTDGYHFDNEYLEKLQSPHYAIASIDDLGAYQVPIEVIINQNFKAETLNNYTTQGKTRFLLGSEYSLVRQEFQKNKGLKSHPSQAQEIFLCFGGSDPHNYTLKCIERIKSNFPALRILVVVGSHYPHLDALKKKYLGSESNSVTIYHDPTSISDLMRKADLAVVSSGSIVWELGVLGIPLFLLSWVENQVPVGKALGSEHCAVYFGSATEIDTEAFPRSLGDILSSQSRRETLSCNMKKICPGDGTAKVLECLFTLRPE